MFNTEKKKKFIISIFIIIAIAISGCVIYNLLQKNNTTSLGKVENGYRVDVEPIKKHFPNLGVVEKVFWKADTIGISKRGSVPAPSSYWMKGFVVINGEEANKLKSKYKWEDMESSWKPSLDTEILKVKSLKWSYSEDFDNYIKSSDYVGKFYLDLKNGIVFFDVQR